MPEHQIGRERDARNHQPSDLGEAHAPPLAERDEPDQQHRAAERHAVERRDRRPDLRDLDEEARRADRRGAGHHLDQRAAPAFVRRDFVMRGAHQAILSYFGSGRPSASAAASHSPSAGSASIVSA